MQQMLHKISSEVNYLRIKIKFLISFRQLDSINKFNFLKQQTVFWYFTVLQQSGMLESVSHNIVIFSDIFSKWAKSFADFSKYATNMEK